EPRGCREQGARGAGRRGPRLLGGARAEEVRERPQGGDGPRRRSPAVAPEPLRTLQSMVAAFRAATSTGSQTGASGGAYDRSRLATSSTCIRFQIAVASTSMRLPAPSSPAISAPTILPVERSARTLTVMGSAP